METSDISPLLLFFLLFSLLQTSAIADKKAYIVYLGSHSFGPNPSPFDYQLATESHYDILGSVLGSKVLAKESIFYSYNKHINGFAAMMDEKQASDLAKLPNVVSVLENQKRELHTTRSWNFLGIENDNGIPSNSIWNAARFGEDVIIGNLDTGVWPESKSFSDEGYGPVPSRWLGTCDSDPTFHCNRKLIGARYFNQGLIFGQLSKNSSFHTARDEEGHGSHTLSTAGGNFVPGASIFNIGNGTAKGGSPKARVAAYKVCWPATVGGGCYDADILAGFEAAISDGVDILSVSLGGPAQEFSKDSLSIGAFHAVQKGIVVVCSAGNDGPSPGTASNVSPWILTVGASTMDRDFAIYLALGNGKHIKGSSLSDKGLPASRFFPLINSIDAQAANVSASQAQLCEVGSLDPIKVRGKIIICLRGENSRVEKGYVAGHAGAVGMILANDEASGNEIIADLHLLPASHVTYADGQSIYQYMNSTKEPVAYMTHVRTQLGSKPAPVMAAFSSRGPNVIDESILKPDITAPGVNVIAAYTNAITPTGQPFDTRHVPYITMSGTSMSCPHISGIVGLLKTLHPKWSPAAIKSAIMTTAKTKDNARESILDASKLKTTPFAYGSGQVHPNSAMDPGLVYDIAPEDYLNYLCARGYNETQIKAFSNKPFTCAKSFKVTDLNYPSISVLNLAQGPVTVNRKVKNVGTPGMYVARVKSPQGVSITVVPNTLQFMSVAEEKSFQVTFKSVGGSKRQGYLFGKLIWSDGKHNVRSPIAVKMG